MTFSDLGLVGPITAALSGAGITVPTPIQVKAIPSALQGRDVIGIAQTGTGKTAAFTLPIIQRLTSGAVPQRRPGSVRALVLSPTRELAAQIHKSLREHAAKVQLRTMCITGGVSIRPQIKQLGSGVDVIIATPGRLLDLVDQRAVRFEQVEVVVLDEADQMLDIGFMPAIRKILALTSAKRQTMLFSATMPREIRELADRHLREPVEVSVAPVAATADLIGQTVMHVAHEAKVTALVGLARKNAGKRAIVFTRTKRGADRLCKRLESDGIAAAAIHGNKSQGQRERALAGFRAGSCPILIATDIAARGIDVPGVELVVNYDMPNVAEVYVHRIGRTGRAGASGQAVSLVAGDERTMLRDIERLIRKPIPVDGPVPAPIAAAKSGQPAPRVAKPGGARPSGRNRRRRSGAPGKSGAPHTSRAAAAV